MRYVLGCVALLLFALISAAAAQRNLVCVTFEARVVSIVDGDTVDVVRAG